MSNDFNKRPIIVMDFETTGIDPTKHEIIEIGAVMVDHQLQYMGGFDAKIYPTHLETAQAQALEINGYNEEAWRYAQSLPTVLREFTKFADDGIFCAWNITFEYRFLFAAIQQLGIINPYIERRYSHHIDIPSIAWFHYEGQAATFDYENVTHELGIAKEPLPHRAYAGAVQDLLILRELRRRQHERRETVRLS